MEYRCVHPKTYLPLPIHMYWYLAATYHHRRINMDQQLHVNHHRACRQMIHSHPRNLETTCSPSSTNVPASSFAFLNKQHNVLCHYNVTTLHSTSFPSKELKAKLQRSQATQPCCKAVFHFAPQGSLEKSGHGDQRV